MRRGAGVAAFAMVLAGASHAQTVYTGGGGQIRDQTDNRFSLFVPDHGFFIDINEITINMHHLRAGDLYIEMRHKTPADYSVVLCDRPGYPESAAGNSDDLNGIYRFRDGFAPLPEDAGAGIIPPTFYGPAVGEVIGRTGSSRFGEWSLLIADRAAGDAGLLTGWSINFRVPAPGPAIVFVAGSVIAAGRRRK